MIHSKNTTIYENSRIKVVGFKIILRIMRHKINMRNIKMDKFYELFAEALEVNVNELDDSRVLLDMEEWDSIAALGVIAFAEQEFSKTINGDQLELCTTIGELKELIFKNDN